MGVRCSGFLCHFLLRGKKWRKKPDFGKPKSQVCLFAKREHRASAGANIARQAVPSWISLGIATLQG
jgi:hypothetical protein